MLSGSLPLNRRRRRRRPPAATRPGPAQATVIGRGCCALELMAPLELVESRRRADQRRRRSRAKSSPAATVTGPMGGGAVAGQRDRERRRPTLEPSVNSGSMTPPRSCSCRPARGSRTGRCAPGSWRGAGPVRRGSVDRIAVEEPGTGSPKPPLAAIVGSRCRRCPLSTRRAMTLTNCTWDSPSEKVHDPGDRAMGRREPARAARRVEPGDPGDVVGRQRALRRVHQEREHGRQARRGCRPPQPLTALDVDLRMIETRRSGRTRARKPRRTRLPSARSCRRRCRRRPGRCRS